VGERSSGEKSRKSVSNHKGRERWNSFLKGSRIGKREWVIKIASERELLWKEGGKKRGGRGLCKRGKTRGK